MENKIETLYFSWQADDPRGAQRVRLTAFNELIKRIVDLTKEHKKIEFGNVREALSSEFSFSFFGSIAIDYRINRPPEVPWPDLQQEYWE